VKIIALLFFFLKKKELAHTSSQALEL